MRPDAVYALVAVGAILALFARRLRAGKLTPSAAAAVAATVSPAVVPLIPVPYLSAVLLFGAGFYMIFCEVVESATGAANPRR